MSSKLERGTVIGSVECSGCGAEVPLKVNSAGGVYYFCARVIGERDGKPEKCMTRFNFGRTASERTIDQFLEQEGKNNAEQVEHRQEEYTKRSEEGRGETEGRADDTGAASGDGNGEAGADPQPERKLGGAIKHFFTGE